MITLALFNILPVNYLGGIVVGLFISGLFYSWFNSWRKTNKLIKDDMSEQSMLEKEEEEMETEYPSHIVHSIEYEQSEREAEKEKAVTVAT